ncbi:MAG TPA: SgcJ/EcaC family oxidoreductase [Kineosporiaceae bacterium]|jgi:steroid delta-isomerase-like uncharacterized protein|nr:SgcJ/EcaC family oxidoreductase [Kineosporiaceae bacterium]
MQTRQPSAPLNTVTARTAALNRHDAGEAAAFFATDADLTDVGTGQRSQGRDAIREATEGFLALFTDLRIEKTSTLCTDDRYAAEWVMSGIHTGDLPGLPATGRSFSVAGASVGQVRDGLIVHATEYWNMADFLTQVGLIPTIG